MKVYEVIKTCHVEATDREECYILFLYKGALLQHINGPLEWFQSTIFERIMPEDMEDFKKNLCELELPDVPNELRYVSKHNYVYNLTYAKRRAISSDGKNV